MTAAIKVLDLVDLSFSPISNQDTFQVIKLIFQAIIQQLDIKDLKLEFKGDDAANIEEMAKSAQEYLKRDILNPPKSTQERSASTISETFSTESGAKKKLVDDTEDILVVENGTVLEGPQRRTPVTQSSFNRLEGKVRSLQAQVEVLGVQTMPSNEAVLEKVRSEHDSKPITELLQTFNITKRMSGAEEGLDRLASLLENVAKEYADLKTVINRMQEEFGQDMCETMKQIKQASQYAQNLKLRQLYYHTELKKEAIRTLSEPDIEEEKREESNIPSKEDEEQIESMDFENEINELPAFKTTDTCSAEQSDKDYINILDKVIKPIQQPAEVTVRKLNELLEQHENIKHNIDFLTYHMNTLADFAEAAVPEIFKKDPNLDIIKERIRDIHTTPLDYVASKKLQKDLIAFEKAFVERLDTLECKLSKFGSLLQKHDGEIKDKTRNLFQDLEELRKDIKTTMVDLNVLKACNNMDDKDKENNTICRLDKEVSKISYEQLDLHRTQKRIESEIDTHQAILLNMKDDLINLKSVKLGKLELEEILSTKADCYLLSSKVSEEQFSLAYNDLTKGLDYAIDKINSQNVVWQNVIGRLMDILEKMVIKEEFEKFKDNIMKSISAVNVNNNQTADSSKEDLAYGTKNKYIRNLKCISCDREVSMKAENQYPSVPVLKKMTHLKTNAPFRAYELKHLKSNSGSHSTNRYAGGSHTLMSPQHKVPQEGELRSSLTIN